MTHRLASIVVGILANVTAVALLAQSPDATAKQIQAHYQTVQDFTADFTHTYEGGVLRKKTTERGTVLIKKPGKMRWTYTAPEQKVFVSDGIKIYAYVPADRQVTVSRMPADDSASTPILFLVGKGDLVRDFAISDAQPAAHAGSAGAFPPDTYALHLQPRVKVPEYEWLTLVVDRGSLKLRMLIARDGQGGTSTFTFTNLKENVKLSDDKFTFSIPRGADVVTQS